MYRPTARVLTVLELLQSKSHLSGPELASRLEVDVRTVRRYITILQDLGIPVETEIGRYGGYTLRAGFKLSPLMFTDDEVLALTLGLLAARKLGLNAIATSAEGALAKIERVLPTALRPRVAAVQETLVLDMLRADTAVASEVLATLSIAAQQCHQLQLWYQNERNQLTERVFDPYGVVYRGGRWYTVGYCHLRAALRVFRVDRISQVEPKAETFARPANFDCLDYVVQSFAAIPDKWDVEVLLALSLQEAHPKVPPGLAVLEQQPEGVLLRASINNLDWMARFLVSLDCSFIVQQPEQLRLALQELAADIMRLA